MLARESTEVEEIRTSAVFRERGSVGLGRCERDSRGRQGEKVESMMVFGGQGKTSGSDQSSRRTR